MPNPFTQNASEDQKDSALVDAALAGDGSAIEELLSRHQPWIYNIALRMVYDPQDAQDVTQEVLLKILLRLSSFRKESSFRTWMYRIVANHVLTVRKKQQRTISFSEYAKILDDTPDLELPDADALPVDASLLVRETEFECMMGMLLCLDPEQRLVFILGGLMDVSDTVGSEILGITRDNFRQKLSRARHDLQHFMESNCGLVNPDNLCHCARKTKALIDRGVVNPHRLVYNANYYQTIREAVGEKLQAAEQWFQDRTGAVLAGQPFYTTTGFAAQLKLMLGNAQFREIFNFTDGPAGGSRYFTGSGRKD